MGSAYFTPAQESSDGGRYLAGEATVGPWDPRFQHGGPPSALLVRAAERAARAHTGRTDLLACRLGAEFLGPVPAGEISTRTRVVRAARTGTLVEVVLSSGDRECLHGRVWLIRRADTSDAAAAPAPEEPPPDTPPAFGMSFPYARSIDWHEVSGSIVRPGPGVVWARPRPDLVPGEPLTGLQRVVLIGDSASGISSELDWAHWSFPNVDLDVHLARPFRGEWVRVDARTQLGTDGAALARATISDRDGPVGASAQTLVLVPR